MDLSKDISAAVSAAFHHRTPLEICAGGSKSFLGQAVKDAEKLQLNGHSGIIEYDPAELVIVARAGTPLLEIEKELKQHNQMLGFEPPFAANGATLGGAIAAGLAGPRRAFSGAVRDFMLGAKFVNGKGEIITTGGKVIKNVAGFDLFRPMAGSMGTLGVLLTASLRVLPLPELEKTLQHAESDEYTALEKIRLWSGKTQSISAATWDGQMICIRLSGSESSIHHGKSLIGGDWQDDENYWQRLNDFELDFFKQAGRLWRISVPPLTDAIHDGDAQLIDWGGAQRWLKSDKDPAEIRTRIAEMGGHASCYNDASVETFHPLSAPQMAIQKRFKAALDPAGIFNPGRLYPGL